MSQHVITDFICALYTILLYFIIHLGPLLIFALVARTCSKYFYFDFQIFDRDKVRNKFGSTMSDALNRSAASNDPEEGEFCPFSAVSCSVSF